MRESGIDVIGKVSWGTHFCQFYQTRQDLIEILVPYFHHGLRQNDFCMWATSEPLTVEGAKAALRSAVADLDSYLEKGQIEIVDCRQWYTASGRFQADCVLRSWVDKQRAAAKRGHEGLRLTGNTFCLQQRGWCDFADYEGAVNSVLGKYRMIALCTYPLDDCGPHELIQVVSNHQFALIKQAGAWKTIESQQHRDISKRRRAEDALREAHDALGIQVQERTADLAKAVEALEAEARGRAAAQQRVTEQAKFLEAFFKHALTPLVFLDRRFNFIRVNEAYAKACQRDVSQFPGHNHFEFYPHRENEAIFREVVRTKVPYQAVAKPFRFPDHPEWGTTYWDWTLVPILDAAGEVEFLVFSLNDVTQRAEAERRNYCTRDLLELFARKSTRKEYLAALVELLREWSGCRCVGIRIVDEEGNIPYESYVGFSREFWEVENGLCLKTDICICIRVIAQTFEPQDAPVITPGGSFRTDNAVRFVSELSPAQQTRFRGNCVRSGFASIAVVPIRYRGEVLGAIHLADQREGMVPLAGVEFLESMTPLIGEAVQRFSVEERLRAAYAYARGLIEASLDPLVTIDPQGKITDVNKATEAVTGMPREQLIGSDFCRYFTDPAKAEESYHKVLFEGWVRDYPLTIRHVSGSTTDVLYNGAVYRNEAGQVQGVVAAARDITERKEAEDRVRILHHALQRRAAQLQTLASELTLTEQRERRRLAQLLHDHLQQLLYAARLSLSALRRRALEEGLQQTIDQIDDLLGQCIAESRSLTVEISPPVLYDAGLAPALQWLARHMGQTYGLGVEVEIAAEAEPEIEDLRVLLFQSVRELLFNVVKHAEVQRATVTMTRSPDGEIQIVVADEGVGFDPAKLHLGEASAAGFGLFSMRERLQVMGGGFRVDTAPGKGTRVMVSAPPHRLAMPLEKQPAPGVSQAGSPSVWETERASPGEAAKIRVLLADDHAIFRSGLVNLLEEEPDIEVVAQAGDGEAAVAAALRSRPDVVLMDVGMPRLDGVEATRRIAAALPAARIIGLSGHQDEDLAASMYRAGAVMYLVKDSPPEALLAAVRGTPLGPASQRPETLS